MSDEKRRGFTDRLGRFNPAPSRDPPRASLAENLASIYVGDSAEVIAHCAKCGLALTAGSEGECFTVCDQCWESERAMSDAKRYDVTEKYIGTGEYVGAMEESATGDWVAFSDYDALKARLAEAERLLRAALPHIRHQARCPKQGDQCCNCGAAQTYTDIDFALDDWRPADSAGEKP